MDDTNTTLRTIKDTVKEFIDERDWAQFHHPKDLAMNLSCEAAELLELFLWASNNDIEKALKEDPKFRERVCEEMGDVFFTLVNLANRLDGDLATIFFEKLNKIGTKYKPEECRGSYTKK